MTSSSWRKNSKSKKDLFSKKHNGYKKLITNANHFAVYCRKDFEISQQLSKIEDEQAISSQLQKKLKELQVNVSQVSFVVISSFCYGNSSSQCMII